MQKRIYWMLGIALALLAIVFGLKSFDGQSAQGTRMVEDREFKVEDVEDIAKIFIADRNGYTTKLEKQPNGSWLLDDKYEAYDNAMDNLLDVIGRIEMQFIPPNGSIPTIVKNLSTEGIHVEIFDKGGNKIKGYYIGGSTRDERGTYAIIENTEQPYVVHIPGWTGNIRFRYSLIDQEWRSKKLFFTNVEDIKSVSVDYPTRRNRSFVLERGEEDKFFIRPFYETDQAKREITRGRAEQYLVNFEESFLSEHQNRDEKGRSAAMSRTPFATVRLERMDGTAKDVKCFPRFNEAYESLDPNTDAFVSALGGRGYDLLINNNEDYAVASSKSIGKFLKTYQNF